MTTNRLTDFDEKVKFYVNESVLEKIVGNELVICETKKNTGNGEVQVKYMRPNCYAFKMDLEPRSIYLFRETIRVNDELILWVEENKITAFILELKSNQIGKAKEQIRFGKKYADFLIGIIEELMRYTFEEKEYRGYIFSTQPSNKNTVRQKDYLDYDEVMDDIYIKKYGKASYYDFRAMSLPIKKKN